MAGHRICSLWPYETDLSNFYFWTLLEKIGFNEDEFVCKIDGINGRLFDYENLLGLLYETEFYSPVEKDVNLIDWVKEYRMNFSQTIDEKIAGCPTVLEVLVCLSLFADDEYRDENKSEQDGFWFWKMIANIGLGEMTNSFLYENGPSEYYEKIGMFLEHDYGKNGEGNAFKESLTDDKLVDDIAQLTRFLSNFYQIC